MLGRKKSGCSSTIQQGENLKAKSSLNRLTAGFPNISSVKESQKTATDDILRKQNRYPDPSRLKAAKGKESNYISLCHAVCIYILTSISECFGFSFACKKLGLLSFKIFLYHERSLFFSVSFMHTFHFFRTARKMVASCGVTIRIWSSVIRLHVQVAWRVWAFLEVLKLSSLLKKNCKQLSRTSVN